MKIRWRIMVAALLQAGVPPCVQAQHVHPPQGHYAGVQDRGIKALSDTEIRELLGGEGGGMALAAELNGYPGPRHVIDLAAALRLAPATIERVEQIRARMQEQAVAIGTEIVARERELDQLFAVRGITASALDARLLEIGALRARLRAVHLHAHLQVARLLSTEEITTYNALRGYTLAR